ncbi:putative bifunctional diguanylate cyclase/phosphodiesterase [Phycisphaera mikurensis]|uniref:Signaling protein n=1 Tax=Phycisphaera mikurensis (strain NBRC 102666 / KCTC 22515 / FYK2301M01) TaxID=1142394 RepID=I0IEJ4_PHYMF|nr:EAL domain-containing protein [Phycisphaera mikurensis]MBB6441481.1 diguanylate cyclase (GGDEF)-like protein [Phycisphaera mikurensis]BAM03682.1 hypothetical protein PSMK_15230 [Phycisphaera mikurensis NBRC 102666]
MHAPHPSRTARLLDPAAEPAAASFRVDDGFLRRMRASCVDRSVRRLTLSYTVGLLLIAALTVGAYLRVEGALRQQRSDAAVINVAGKQRMLSQRITKAAMAMAGGASVGEGGAGFGSELREAIAAFELGHTALTVGNDAVGVPPTVDAEAVSRIRRLGPSFEALVAAAEAIADGADPKVHLPVLLAEQAQFLPEQDALVSRFATLSRAKVARLEADHAWLLWITLGLLLAEAVLVFAPAARAMRRQLQILHEAGEIMSHEAKHDALTGLANRNALLQHLEVLLHAAHGDAQEEVAVYFLDFDRFKAINDSLGHEAGDRLLKEIASRARVLMDDPRVGRLEAFRLGGDEFVLVLHGRSIGHEIRPLADRALVLFGQPCVLDGHPCVSTASIGIATASGPRPGDASRTRTASELLRNADLAMMQAKAAGKARYMVFDETMYRYAQRRQRLEHDLREAVDTDRLGVRYLPIVSADHSGLVAVEAIARWDHPQLGLLEDAELLEVATDAGLVHELSDRVLRRVSVEVAAAAAAPNAAPLPWIHLNVSRAEASHPAFPDRLAAALVDCPPLAGRLCLEFAEDNLGRGLDHFSGLVQRVSALGVKTCIDDLGGAHASLGDLARLGVDQIKIQPGVNSPDRLVDPLSLLVPRAVVAFARGVGVEVTATGVDCEPAVAVALDLGVEALQGLHFGGPGSLEEVLRRAAGSGGIRLAA